ncbi:hypothetical protein [Thermococcus prieurii]
MRFSARNPTPEVAPSDIVYVKTEQFHSESAHDERVVFLSDVPLKRERAKSHFDTLDAYETYFDGVRHAYLAAGELEVSLSTNAGNKIVSVPYFLTIAFEDTSERMVIAGVINGIRVSQVAAGEKGIDLLMELFLRAAEEGDADSALAKSTL